MTPGDACVGLWAREKSVARGSCEDAEDHEAATQTRDLNSGLPTAKVLFFSQYGVLQEFSCPRAAVTSGSHLGVCGKKLWVLVVQGDNCVLRAWREFLEEVQ